MKKWALDNLLAPVVIAMVLALAHAYVDVQILKHRLSVEEREMALMRAELTDLWMQANDQLQERAPTR